MAVLPTDNLNLNGTVRYEDQPGRTWKIDREKGRIVGECDNWEAVRQAVEIILWTERFRWQIYRPWSGVQYEGLIGLDPGYVAAELKRRVREALLMDSRVTGLTNYAHTFSDGILHATFTVTTVFGNIEESAEVRI